MAKRWGSTESSNQFNHRVCRCRLLVNCDSRRVAILRGLSGLIVFMWATTALQLPAPRAVADEPAAPVEPQADAPAQPVRQNRGQLADDEAGPLQPLNPLSVEEQNRLDALAWYSTGRLLEVRTDREGAWRAYEQAIALDPSAVDAYRALVKLGLELDRLDKSAEYAEKALALDPKDVELLRHLAGHRAAEGQLPAAIDYLERALASGRLDRQTAAAVLLHRDLGILYSATGLPDKAADNFAVVFEAVQKPEKFGLDLRRRNELLNDPQTNYERLCLVLLVGAKLDLARTALELAEKSGRSSVGNLQVLRSRLELAGGHPEQALVELEKYLGAQRQSKGRDAYLLLVEILGALKQSDQVLNRLRSLAEADPRNLSLQYFYAERLAESGDLEGARAVYEAAVQGGGDAQGHMGLVAIYRQLKRPEELLQALARSLARLQADQLQKMEEELEAISKDQELVNRLLEAGRRLAATDEKKLTYEKAYLIAKLASQAGEIDSTIEFYRLAIKQNRDEAYKLYEELGRFLLERRKYADAVRIYEEAAADRGLVSRSPDIYLQLAHAREFLGDTDGALEAINEARKLVPNPNHPYFLFQEGWIYAHARDFEKALPILERVINEHPDEKRIVRLCLLSKSNIYVQQGQILKGEEILERIYEDDPKDVGVNNDLGYLYADQGKNLERAEEMIRMAVNERPDNAAYLDSLGWVLFKKGKIPEAIAELRKATALPDGGDSTILEHLADCLHAAGELDEAKSLWTKALERAREDAHPDPTLLKRLEEKLERLREAVPAATPAAP